MPAQLVKCCPEALDQIFRPSLAVIVQEDHARVVPQHVDVHRHHLQPVLAQCLDDRVHLRHQHGNVSGYMRLVFTRLLYLALDFTGGVLELANAAAQTLCQFRNALGPEEQQDEEYFCASHAPYKSEHVGNFYVVVFMCLNVMHCKRQK